MVSIRASYLDFGPKIVCRNLDFSVAFLSRVQQMFKDKLKISHPLPSLSFKIHCIHRTIRRCRLLLPLPMAWLDSPNGPRTPLDEWSARCKDLCLTTHYTHKRQITMPPGFEATIPASERP